VGEDSDGGGGGGGYYGGGGGGAANGGCDGAGGGGGGAGSSYGPPGTLFAQDTTGVARVAISWTFSPPDVSIVQPSPNAIYTQGEDVPSGFTCSEGSGGPGLASCLDQDGQSAGAQLDTSSTGPHTFTVTATSSDGLTSDQTVTYTVESNSSPTPTTPVTTSQPAPTSPAPSLPTPSIGDLQVGKTFVSAVMHCAGSGSCQFTLALHVTETFKSGKLIAVTAKQKTSERTVSVGTTSITLDAGQSEAVTVELNGTGQSLLKTRHTLHAKLIASSGTSVLSSQTVAFKQSKKSHD